MFSRLRSTDDNELEVARAELPINSAENGRFMCSESTLRPLDQRGVALCPAGLDERCTLDELRQRKRSAQPVHAFVVHGHASARPAVQKCITQRAESPCVVLQSPKELNIQLDRVFTKALIDGSSGRSSAANRIEGGGSTPSLTSQVEAGAPWLAVDGNGLAEGGSGEQPPPVAAAAEAAVAVSGSCTPSPVEQAASVVTAV